MEVLALKSELRQKLAAKINSKSTPRKPFKSPVLDSDTYCKS